MLRATTNSQSVQSMAAAPAGSGNNCLEHPCAVPAGGRLLLANCFGASWWRRVAAAAHEFDMQYMYGRD